MASLKDLEARVPVPGSLVAGRYRLQEILGEGGFGEVWRVEDTHSGHCCALKFLCHDVDATRVALFKEEFALLTRLAHPHVNPVHDFGHDPQFGYYFTSALVSGVSLHKAARGQPVAVVETLAVQALRALAYLHRQGIAHYDIKPANLLVAPAADGTPHLQVIDFGLASMRAPTTPMGTPSYMAPEFFLDQPVDSRADLYALGVVLYLCLTGYNPFRAATLAEAKPLHLHVVADAPSVRAPKVPAYWDDVLARLLAKDPAARYAGAAHALRELCFLSPHQHVVEESLTAQAAVPAGTLLIGRAQAREQLAHWLGEADTAAASGAPVLLVEGSQGMGKTSILQAVKFQAQLQGHPVCWLAGAEDPAQDAFASQLAQLLATTNPPATVVLLDDVDAIFGSAVLTTLQRLIQALLDRLNQAGAGSPVRVGMSWEHAVPALALPRTERVALPPFTVRETTAYLDAVVTMPESHRARLARQLTRRSGGSPAVVRALLQGLIAQGQLADASGVWDTSQFDDVRVDLATVDVPRALLRGMERRAAAIPVAHRGLAHCLAVWGEPVAIDALRQVAGVSADMVSAALGGDWIHHDVKTDRLSLTEPLLAEVLVRNLPVEERQRWHGRIAGYLQQSPAAALSLNYHLAESDDPRADAAFVAWCEGARRNGQLLHSLRSVQRRLAARALAPAVAVALQLQLAQLQLQADCLAESQTTLEQILQACPAPETAHWMAVEQLAKVHLRSHRLDAAQALLHPAITHTTVDAVAGLRLRNTLARLHLVRGELVQAEALYQETQTAALRLPSEEQQRIDNNELGHCWLLQGKMAAAIAWLERACADIALAPLRRAQWHHHLGNAFRQTRAWERARAQYEQGIAIARQEQDLRLLTALYNGYGALLAEGRDYAAAIVHLERALPLCYRSGDFLSAVTIRLNLGHLYLRQDQVAPAEAELRAALAGAEGRALEGYATDRVRCPIHQLLGELARRRHAWHEATTHLDTAWALAQAHDLIDRRCGIQLTRAEAACDQHDMARARCWLDDAITHPHTAEEAAAYRQLAARVGGVKTTDALDTGA